MFFLFDGKPIVLTTVFEFQDSFYKYHNEEELALAHANLLDFDHPDAIDMSMFASVCAPKFGFITTYN